MVDLALKPTEKLGKIKYIPIQKEFSWIVDNSKTIIKNGFANVTNSTTLYTVPKGKILYLTNLSLTGENTHATNPDSINISIAGNIIFEMYVPGINYGSVFTVALPLTLPLIVESGDKVVISAGADAKVIGSFIGYEIDKKNRQNKNYTF